MTRAIFLLLIFTSFFFTPQSSGQSASTFINEINYLASNPTQRGVEIAGEAGTNLAGWSVVVYALNGTVQYVEYISSGVIPNQQNGYGTIWYDVEQHGTGGGLALINPSGGVVQFLSYGTVNFAQVIINAVNGPASGMTSAYSGTQLLPFKSLMLTGTGIQYAQFLWSLPSFSTPGEVNTLQFFSLPPIFAGASSGNEKAVLQASHQPQVFSQEAVKVHVFPNPAVNTLQVRWDEAAQPGAAIIRLFDANGRLVQQAETDNQTIGSTELDVTSLPSGQYFLKVWTNNTANTIAISKQ